MVTHDAILLLIKKAQVDEKLATHKRITFLPGYKYAFTG
jgi:hypothetical protein